jgi:hypothetical protein
VEAVSAVTLDGSFGSKSYRDIEPGRRVKTIGDMKPGEGVKPGGRGKPGEGVKPGGDVKPCRGDELWTEQNLA